MRAEKTLNSQSRANLVRERRNQQSQQRVNAIRKNPAQANRTYKSTVRGSTAPLRQVAAPKVRRQVYYALGTSGAELRLPAVPFIHFGWRLISGMLVILLGLALYAIIYSPRFQVSGIQIEGIQRLTSGDISAVVDISGKSIVNFNPKQAADALASAFPELAEIDIAVHLPAEIVISVVERQPSIAWIAEGKTYWIDSDGIILPPRGEAGSLLEITSDSQPPLLPVEASASNSLAQNSLVDSSNVLIPTTGTQAESGVAIWGQQIDPDIMKRISDLQSRIEADSKPVYSASHGLGWQDPRGWDVYVGKELSNFEIKLAVIRSIIAELEAKGSLPQELISVEYIDAPYYK